jgi:flagellin FlaB
MFDNINNVDDNDRGQVGIGTLIVFIALVLVAAIAAGVLINTAGFLQNQAESTGQESADQVTQSVSVQQTLGTANTSSAIKQIDIRVSKAPGSDPINASDATIQFVTPRGAATLTPAADVSGTGKAIGTAFYQVDASGHLLEDNSDTYVYTIKLAPAPSNAAMEGLAPGDEAEVVITTESGGQTTTVLNVPEPLTADDTDQVRL